MALNRRPTGGDPFLLRYDESELRIASEFLVNWLPFLSKDLCRHCTRTLSDRIRSLSSDYGDTEEPSHSEENGSSLITNSNDNCDTHSLGSWKDEADTHSLGSWKDGANGWSDPPADDGPSELSASLMTPESTSRGGGGRMSWADMAQEEDELEAKEDRRESESSESRKQSVEGNSFNEEPEHVPKQKVELSREQREYIRFMNVKRKKDFICLERVNGRIMNILQGLELHTGVFSAVEQTRIVNTVYELLEKGRKGELKDRTYTAPRKWMRGKGRQTIQFGCCYNYATDKNGNPPGILQTEMVDSMPPLFKVIIRRLIKWHVLPPSCVPDSCIVNIYEEGDCIPPHIDNHDFVRPFCTISFLCECDILFGTDLKIVGPGEFSGSYTIPLPVGSVLVLNGNGADLAKHCVPAVPAKRISITFRKMDEEKRPHEFVPEPDLQDIEPLCYDAEMSNNSTQIQHNSSTPTQKNSSTPRVSGSSTPRVSGSSTPRVSSSSTPRVSSSSTPAQNNSSTPRLSSSSTPRLGSSSTARLSDSSTARLNASSTARLDGNSTARLDGNSTARLDGNSTARLDGNSTARLDGSSTARLNGSSTARLNSSSTPRLDSSSTPRMNDSSSPILNDSPTPIVNSSTTRRQDTMNMLQASDRELNSHPRRSGEPRYSSRSSMQRPGRGPRPRVNLTSQ